jgi:hypothetical protein
MSMIQTHLRPILGPIYWPFLRPIIWSFVHFLHVTLLVSKVPKQKKKNKIEMKSLQSHRPLGGSCPVHNGLDMIQLKTEIFLYKSKSVEKDTSFF